MRGKPTVAAFLALSWVASTNAVPKVAEDKGFQPSKNGIYSKDQLAMESKDTSTTALDKSGRFGFPTYAADGQGVNNVVPGLYGPLKLDIGGLVLGTIVGFGAFFILPKLFHVISSPYGGGGYKRSEDEPSAGGSSLSEIYRQFSESLEAMNLDQAACLQRALCYSVQNSATSESIVDMVSKNELLKTMLSGTDWDLALKVGKTGESCGAAFPKCPFTVDSVIKPLIKYFME